MSTTAAPAVKQRPRYQYILRSGRAVIYEKLGLSQLERCDRLASDKFPKDDTAAVVQTGRERVMHSLRAITLEPVPPIFKTEQKPNPDTGLEETVVTDQLDEDAMFASIKDKRAGGGWTEVGYLDLTTANGPLSFTTLFDDEPGDYLDVMREVLEAAFPKKRAGGSPAQRRPVS